jgi:hypothetical protein
VLPETLEIQAKLVLRVTKEIPDTPVRPVPQANKAILVPQESKATQAQPASREQLGAEETQELQVQKEKLARAAPI